MLKARNGAGDTVRKKIDWAPVLMESSSGELVSNPVNKK